MGGALGAVANGVGAAVVAKIATSKMQTVAKVFACLGFWIVMTIAELAFIFLIYGTLSLVR